MARCAPLALLAIALAAIFATFAIQRSSTAARPPGDGGGDEPRQLEAVEAQNATARRLSSGLGLDAVHTVRSRLFFVHSSWATGPPRGTLQPAIWLQDQAVGALPGNVLKPNGPLPSNNLRRVLRFKTGFWEIFYDVAHSSFSISDGGFTTPAVGGSKCTGPADSLNSVDGHGYPVRVVRSGRYFAQYSIHGLTCAGSPGDMEIKVFPDAFELTLTVPNRHAQFMGNLCGHTHSASGPGKVKASFRILDGQMRVCPLEAVFEGSESRKGRSVTVSGHQRTVQDLGVAWWVTLPQMPAEKHWVTVRNPGSKVATFRIIFNIDGDPGGMTGNSPVVFDSTGKLSSGLHVQISKNWHAEVNEPYKGNWFTAVVMFEVAPHSDFHFLLRFFGALHQQKVDGFYITSHAQLCLMGSKHGHKDHGHWDEVGIGVNGESITYQPNGEKFRAIIADVRPFLTCGRGSSKFGQCNCDKYSSRKCTPETTGWTENHGGGNFLFAIDMQGSHQYLTDVRAVYHANGPKLTNVSYVGVTADGAIEATLGVSTWTANDFVRHLHSFEYKVKKQVKYKRLTLYQIGWEWYNALATTGSQIFAVGCRGTQGEQKSIPFAGEFTRDPFFSQFWTGPYEGCWVGFHTTPDSKLWSGGTDNHQGRHNAHRALIMRDWYTSIKGALQPYVGSLTGIQQKGMGFELNLPKHVESLSPGDVIRGSIELVLYPTKADQYYGTSQEFKALLARAQWWQIPEKESNFAGLAASDVRKGTLERRFPPRVRVDEGRQEAAFVLRRPTEWFGTLPVSVSGVRWVDDWMDGPRSFWYRASGRSAYGNSWKRVCNAECIQIDREASGRFTYTMTFAPKDFSTSPYSEIEVKFGLSRQVN